MFSCLSQFVSHMPIYDVLLLQSVPVHDHVRDDPARAGERGTGEGRGGHPQRLGSEASNVQRQPTTHSTFCR